MKKHVIFKITEVTTLGEEYQINHLISFHEEETADDIQTFLTYLILNLNGEENGKFLEEENCIIYKNGTKGTLLYEEIPFEDYEILKKYIIEITFPEDTNNNEKQVED